AASRIEAFHRAGMGKDYSVETAPGVVCERIIRPVPRVGLYVPAGSAPLPSTALMLCVPAALARCRHVVLCTPPRADGTADPAVLVRSEEHTSELQSRENLVCRLLLEKKKQNI